MCWRGSVVVGWGACFFTAITLGQPEPLGAEESSRPVGPETLIEMAYAAEVAGQPEAGAALVEKILEAEPDNERARWLAGHVRHGDHWATANEIAQSRRTDELLQEYMKRREACGQDAMSRMKLANWCRDHAMPDREKVHLMEIVARHGGNPAIMARLGMVKFRGVWVPEDQVEEFRRLDDRQRRIEKKWRPIFAKWMGDLESGDTAAYLKLSERLKQVADDEALPILEEVLSVHSEKAGLAVVGRLDTLATQGATESLVRHAVFSEFEPVRFAASEALKERPKYNYIPILLSWMMDPLEIEVEYPFGNRGYRRTIATQRGPDYDVRTVSHESKYITRVAVRLRNSRQSRNPLFWPVERRSVSTTDNWSKVEEGHYVEKETAKTRLNEKIGQTLYLLTGKSYRSPEQWRDWWNDYTEYEQEGEKPTYESQFHRHLWAYSLRATSRSSCLAWSTPVVTETGPSRVEQIVPGDKVLAQDPDTGELGYKVVLQRTVRRLGEMRKISLGDDAVTVTLGHPFWVVGKGWRMAKELEVGERVRCLDASREVTAVEELPEDVAYNLVVDDFGTYFAGQSRVLLHDNSLPSPTDAVLPGYVAASP